MGFYMTVLHRRQSISIFKNLVRLLKAFSNIAVFDMEHAANVAAQLEIKLFAVHARVGLIAFGMQHRRAGVGSFEEIEHRWQFFVIDFDDVKGLFRDLSTLRGYERDQFADMAYAISSQDGLIIHHWTEIGVQAR